MGIDWVAFNTLRPRPNGLHIPDDIFKCIFLNENIWIFIKVSLKLFLSVQLTIFQQCSDNGLAPARRQDIAWTNDG